MDLERVTYEVSERVATITLDDPDRRNALGDAMLDDLLAAVRTAGADDEVRVVVLASSHPTVFSAGGDLSQFHDDRPPIVKYEGMARFPSLFRELSALGKPVLCAAGGHVLAGSLGVALACDLVLAAESATFGAPEITVGAFPFMISALIHRSVGRMKANELMFLGERIDAHEAQRLGIVNRVVSDEEFPSAVDDWAARLASFSPLLMRLGKHATRAARDMSFDEALDYLQAQLALAFTTDDLREGVDSFFQDRAPEWQGR